MSNVVGLGISPQQRLRNIITGKLKAGDYTVNLLQHYTFIVDGEPYKIGICELNDAGLLPLV